MGQYNFDEYIDRRGTGSLKFDAHVSRGRDPKLLSLWVADMDFRIPREAQEALAARVEHGIFGYTEPGESYYTALQNWLSTNHGWEIKPEWVVCTPGVVYALAMAVQAFTRPGDAVLIQRPVYYPFTEVIEDNGRTLVNAPLVYKDGTYSIDFEAFEQAIFAHDVKLFLLCNPHNPGGRVWSAEELKRLGEICLKHGVLVCSDEIHMDFARAGYKHAVFASLSPELADITITCTAPSKTFNLAGLQDSNIVISNPKLRAAFKKAIATSGYSQCNAMGLLAAEACYTYGATWLGELKDYLEGNYQALCELIARQVPELHVVEPGSTYLVWIDCSVLGFATDDEVKRFCEDEAGLWLDTGGMFGAEGVGFVRFNIATTRAYLLQAVEQFCAAARARLDGAAASSVVDGANASSPSSSSSSSASQTTSTQAE